MLIDINKYKENRIVSFKEASKKGPPVFEKVYVDGNNAIGQTPGGSRVLLDKIEEGNNGKGQH